MSDEPIRPDQQAVTPSGIFEHWCERPGCEKWGAYGYQIGKQKARYYCLDHRENGERFIGRA